MNIRNAKEDIERIVFPEEQLLQRVREMGRQLTEEYRNRHPVMICVLRGACFFFTDLCRSMDCHVELDFITVSSYGNSTTSSGTIRLTKDIGVDIAGRDVIIVDDIVDSGLTLAHLKKLLEIRGPRSVKICCLLDKKDCHPAELAPDYAGFDCPNAFMVGYGLDYASYYRNLPYIGVLKPEVYED